MAKKTQTKLARTLVDKAGNVSVAPAQEREKVPVDIDMPNGSIKRVYVLISPGQLINQIKLRKRVIEGDFGGSLLEA